MTEVRGGDPRVTRAHKGPGSEGLLLLSLDLLKLQGFSCNRAATRKYNLPRSSVPIGPNMLRFIKKKKSSTTGIMVHAFNAGT